MKEWLTAREIADEHLQGMPATKMGIGLLAERDGWNENPAWARKRAGRGGGMEYHIRLLPLLAQISYKRKHLTVGIVDLPPAANDLPVSEDADSTRRAKLTRDARLAVLKQYDRYRDGLAGMEKYALQSFVDAYNKGVLRTEDWVVELLPAITRDQVRRWSTKKTKGKSLGFDRGAARRGTGVLETAHGGAVRMSILALIADNSHFSAEHIRDAIESEYGKTLNVISKGAEKAVPLPPIRTFQHHLKALRADEKVTLLRVQNPDLFRSTMAPRGTGTLGHVSEPNTLWQIDASPVDALCTDGRHAIYVCIDIATRRKVLLISRTPRASAVALLIRKSILAWGTPETVKTDNGSDFVARDTKRLFAFLGIEVELSDAHTPQQKGHVERAIRDFQHDFATILPGFVGHCVADRSAIESRKSFAARLGTSDAEAFGVELSGEELQVEVDRWVQLREHKLHSGIGTTPALAASRSTKPRRDVDERALDALLMTVAAGGTRRVTAQGIRVDGSRYMTPSILPGTDVLVRMDTADLGLVYAYTPDGETFLGVGICPALSGIEPAAAAKALKAMQNEITAKGAAAIKAEIRRFKSKGAYHERILGVRESRLPQNVLPMPKRSEAHSTPQIAAALAAMDHGEGRRPAAPADPKLVEAQKRLIEEMEAQDEAALWARGRERSRVRAAEIEAERTAHLPKTVRALPESSKAKYVRMITMKRRIEAGEPVDVQYAILLGRYQESHEYKGHARVHAVEGDSYLAL